MSVKGPIIIIDNDHDDQELVKLAFKEIEVPNKLLVFDDGDDALKFLINSGENPFLIISDVKMPRMNGIELRSEINNNEKLKRKCIPFIFLSEMAEPAEVLKAYELNVQGFFIKPSNIEKLKNNFQMIVEYWQNCVEPNQVLAK